MKCDLFTIIQTIASVVACIIAVFIPRKISWEQMYTQLLSEYLGYDFGAAVMGIVFFFNKDCEGEIKNIKEKYKEKFYNQFGKTKKDESFYTFTVPNEQNLHYQRRLLTQFFFF